MWSKISALACALILLFSLALPVSAAQETWIELLEYSSVLENGDNWFTIGSTGSVTLSLHGEQKLKKIDLLITNPDGQRPTSATVTYGSTTNKLDIFAVSNTLTRIVGVLPFTFYEQVTVNFAKPSSTVYYYDLLSFKVSPLDVQEFEADASVTVSPAGVYPGGTYGVTEHIKIPDTGTHVNYQFQCAVKVKDWQKYDKVTIWGSTTNIVISSIRATVDITGVPITVNYIGDTTRQSWELEEGSYYESIDQWYSDSFSGEIGGKTLYCVTIDLSGIDRTSGTGLVVYFTGFYDSFAGGTFNCQYVNGTVTFADTTEVHWWNRITGFLTDLFGRDDPAADQFQEDMQQQSDQMQDAVDQMEDVTRPPLDDVDVDLSGIVSPEQLQTATSPLLSLISNNLYLSMAVITLTLALVAYVLYGKR